MDEKIDLKKLNQDVDSVLGKLNVLEKSKQLNDLKKQSSASDFWNDNIKAGEIMKKINSLEEETTPWLKLSSDIKELQELVSLQDKSLHEDISKQAKSLNEKYQKLKKQLRFTDPHDSFNTVLSIYAGAGGTDAQDWAQMLLRMYTRWAEANNVKASLIDQSAGDEAGIKSASIEFEGSFAFGKLKGEHGVHRLVRLSPFNANNLRQTSFAKVEVLPKIESSDEIEIDEKDLKIDVYRSGGRGGQSVNTTDSAVRITHIPTGIVVAIQNERSQIQNKETAMTILRSKLVRLKQEQHAENLADLKGPNTSAEWGNQIRNYVLHPYNMVKDLRTGHETSQTEAVLDGDLNDFIDAHLEQN